MAKFLVIQMKKNRNPGIRNMEMSTENENKMRTGPQLNSSSNIPMEPEPEPESSKMCGRPLTIRDRTIYAISLNLMLWALAVFVFAFALYETDYQERVNMYPESGGVTKTHMVIGMAVSSVLTVLFSLGLYGVVKEKLGLIKMSIPLLSLSLLGIVGLIIFCIKNKWLGGILMLLVLYQHVSWFQATRKFCQQVKAKGESGNPNQNQSNL